MWFSLGNKGTLVTASQRSSPVNLTSVWPCWVCSRVASSSPGLKTNKEELRSVGSKENGRGEICFHFHKREDLTGVRTWDFTREKSRKDEIGSYSVNFPAPPLQLIYSVVSLLLQDDFYCIFNVGVGSFSVSWQTCLAKAKVGVKTKVREVQNDISKCHHLAINTG